MSDEGVKFRNAKLLADGWQWKIYDDGSGHLENADGKSYFSFDYATQEYVDLNNKWQFMTNYPDSTPMDMFMAEMENDIVESGLASYNDLVDSIAIFEEELEVSMHYRLFQKDRFVGWSAYPNLAEVNKSLYDLLLAAEVPDVFDLSIADKLCENYSAHGVCSMLTDNQKELVVIGVECEQDWSNIVPPNLKLLYEEIISEQSKAENLTIQM